MPLEDYGNFESYNEEIRDKKKQTKTFNSFQTHCKAKEVKCVFCMTNLFC